MTGYVITCSFCCTWCNERYLRGEMSLFPGIPIVGQYGWYCCPDCAESSEGIEVAELDPMLAEGVLIGGPCVG